MGVTWGLVCLVIDGMLFAGAAAMLRWANAGRWLSLRRLSWLPALCLALGFAVVGIGLIPDLVDDTDDADCSSFDLRPEHLRSSDEDRRLSMAEGIAECGLLVNVRQRRFEAILGRPLSRKRTPGEASSSTTPTSRSFSRTIVSWRQQPDDNHDERSRLTSPAKPLIANRGPTAGRNAQRARPPRPALPRLPPSGTLCRGTDQPADAQEAPQLAPPSALQ